MYYFEYVDFFETCPICHWQDDGLQRTEPDLAGGANKLSLNQYRRKWLAERGQILESKAS
jgi:hypothetical protein